jgi:hypothetical protein
MLLNDVSERRLNQTPKGTEFNSARQGVGFGPADFWNK